jgi:transposase
MRYLGIDVHSKVCVWCLLNAQGEIVEQGSTETTIPALQALVARLGKDDELLAGQEVGAMAYLVHDALKEAGVRLLSFNAAHLRMIAASRTKTDRRDAYWIARALQTGMTPHEVYIPVGEVREMRGLLHRREMIQRDFVRWRHRAKSQLRASRLLVSPGLALKSFEVGIWGRG